MATYPRRSSFPDRRWIRPWCRSAGAPCRPSTRPRWIADDLFRLVRAGFGKRRKMLRRALAGMVPAGAFEAAAVRPDSRAENLDIYAWGRLAAAVKAAGDG